MDAKPQRPFRTLRVKADENVPPSGPSHPTIHQRNKSSPALSTMLGAAGLRAPAKRTAFGDVSNTANFNNRPGKEDGAIPLKQAIQTREKSLPPLAEKKSNFLRQASRPISVANLKGLLTGTAVVEQVSKPLPAANNRAQANDRKPLPKPATTTTIFKDVIRPASSDATTRPIAEPVAPHVTLPPIHSSTTAELLPAAAVASSQPTQLSPLLPSDISLGDPAQFSAQPKPTSSTAKSSDHCHTDETQPAEIADGQEYWIDPLLTADKPHETETVASRSALPVLEPVAEYPLKSTAIAAATATAASHSSLPKLPEIRHSMHRPEPEEYWEEEEDEEALDEEGYATTRSFRSRGENSTGGATTVLFPQVNQRVRKEIEAAKVIVDAEKTPEEIEDEFLDTSMVAEYGEEIFAYLTDLEIRMLPNPHYMDNQAEIKWSMRTVLMDWVIQVHHRFNLLPETLFLTVNYIDRFLSCKIVSLGKLQLVGATAIFIAAKYEEINCPSVQEIVYMVDGGYTMDEILKAERFMLTMLQFELGWPGPMSFLRRISKADDYDLETRTLAKYFLEVTVMDEQFIGSPASYIAAAAHCLARLMLRKGRWTARHVHYSGYTYTQLARLLPRILECCRQPRKHHAQVFQKYADKRYKRASVFVEGEMLHGFVLPPSIKEAAISFVPPSWRPL